MIRAGAHPRNQINKHMLTNFIIVGIGMVVGDVFMKSWAMEGYALHGMPLLLYVSGMLVYAGSLTFYAKQLHVTNFSVATTLPMMINIVAVALLTVFFYREAFSVVEWVATVLALASIVVFCFA